MDGSSAGQFVYTRQIDEVRRQVAAARRRGEKVACVPTMGALHAGHLSLIRTAREQCGFVAVTVFVNPTQFGPNEDFKTYPRPLDTDLAACRDCHVDIVFHPSSETMYPVRGATFVEVEGLSNVLEGKFRPGHLRGVAAIVLKLLNVVAPDVAYFGQKDFQQQLLIRRVCGDLHLPVEIHTCPTIRDTDGLALSSRNAFLSPVERQEALALWQSLSLAHNLLKRGETSMAVVSKAMREHLNSMPNLSIDYATIADPETLEAITTAQSNMVALVAARIRETRLIDNTLIRL